MYGVRQCVLDLLGVFGLVKRVTLIVNTQQALQTKITGAAYKLARFDNLSTYFAVTAQY